MELFPFVLISMMSISLTKRNIIYHLALLSLIIGLAGVGILHYALPEHHLGAYPFIPVYFFLFGVFEVYMYDACRKHAPRRILLFYLAMKMMKLLFSILFLAVYCMVINEENKLFLLVFGIYYIIYLVYETWLFSRIK